MKIYKTKDYDAMSLKAATILASQIILKPDSVLGLATGSSPIGMYKKLVEWYEAGNLDFSQVMSVNLDEYRGLAPENEQSYRYFMNTNLFDHVNIRKECTHVPDGLTDNPDQACEDYEALIESLGGVDIQVLGMGHNGHIGFNEPSSDFAKITHCVEIGRASCRERVKRSEREVCLKKKKKACTLQMYLRTEPEPGISNSRLDSAV